MTSLARQQVFPWAALNNFPLDTLVNYCQVNVAASSICTQPEYFQQRFVSHDGDVGIFQNNPFVTPIDKYAYAMASSGLVDRDMSVLDYLMKSNIMFPGLEYYIGLGKMGLRAINQNSDQWLSYVLRKYPNTSEMDKILGLLQLRRFEADEKRVPFTLLDTRTLANLLRTSNIYEITPYYPTDIEEYVKYMNGVRGRPLDLTRIDWTNPYTYQPYVYGLIDGKHVDMLRSLNEYHDSLPVESRTGRYGKVIPLFDESVVRHMIWSARGLDQQDPMFQLFTNYVFPRLDDRAKVRSPGDAVREDNLRYAKFILDNIELGTVEIDYLFPRSIEMVDLLASYGLEVPRINIVSGTLRSGNYNLFYSLTNEDLNVYLQEGSATIAGIEELVEAPFKMVKDFLERTNPPPEVIQTVAELFANEKDFYRLERLLEMLPSGLSEPLKFIKSMRKSLTYDVFSSDRSQYPKVQQLISGAM